MNSYETQARLQGDPHRALEFAATSLTGAGYRIDTRTDSAMILTGPTMLSSNQAPIAGAGHLELQAAGRILRAKADLAGVRFLMRLLGTIIAIVAVIAVITSLFIPAPAGHGRWFMTLIMVAPLCPWPILIPILSSIFHRRTRRAVDALVNNAAKMTQTEL
jgi:hypothetical protein